MLTRDNTKKIADVIPLCANYGLKQQKPDGSLPSGCNGPWDDPDTPVRNTSHWVITFIKAYNLTGEERYYNGAESAVSYLLSREALPEGVAWHHRNSSKSKTNGLVGQAWTIEALIHAVEAGIENNIESNLVSVIEAHPFNERLSGWEYIELDGSSQGVMFTLNQQVWFAAMVSKVADMFFISEFENKVQKFLDHLKNKIVLNDDGAIYHYMSLPRSPISIGVYLLENIKRGRIPQSVLEMVRLKHQQNVGDRTVGYHSFFLTGLAILASTRPSHNFWTSEIIQSALEYAQSDRYYESIMDNKFGLQYNVPGFEIPFIFDVFSDISSTSVSKNINKRLLQVQLSQHYDYETHSLKQSTVDPNTLSARMYEATRILEHEFPSHLFE